MVMDARKKLIWMAGLLALLLGACNTQGPLGDQGEQPEAAVPSPTKDTQAPVEPTQEIGATGTPEQAPTQAPADAPAALEPTPTARAALEATDPTTVNLAAGKPTLLEFFAFW
jgi:hypothetical protein